MNASRPTSRFKNWLWALCLPLLVLILPLALYLTWRWVVLPSAVVYYAEGGKGDIHYGWIVKYQVYRGRLSPGHAITDYGALFPDSAYEMILVWWKDGERSHCVLFTPKWPRTEIYLDADGNIDTREGSGTHKDGWRSCPKGWGDL